MIAQRNIGKVAIACMTVRVSYASQPSHREEPNVS